ncbi:MAG: YkgJ family cysteine cluster protein [Lacunisphaera sp.]|nr:YkgJ family cysteine cluster protein [Lacunisphaera sp.]
MSRAFSLEEEALFEKTGGAVLRRLQKTRNPADLLAVLRSAHKEFDRAYAAAPAAARASVACRAGCGTCCHVPVGVQAHEVLLAAEYIQARFSPADLDGVIARAAAHRAEFAGRTMRERAALKTPCVLLRDESCSIYEARPEACRSHHSNNLAGCRSNLDSGIDFTDVLIPEIRGRMFAVMLSIDQAVAEAGFDGRAYDFGSALHEALTDSLCAVRWTQRLPAFPDDCHEVGAPDEGEDAGVIRAEGFFQ